LNSNDVSITCPVTTRHKEKHETEEDRRFKVKRLYKSRKDKVIDGVCAGIAEYFDLDPVLVRVVFVLFFIFGGMGFVAYIVGMIVIPRRPLDMEETSASQETAPPPPPPTQETSTSPVAVGPNKGSLIIGVILVGLGAMFLIDNFAIFRGFYFWGWFRRHFWDFLVPGIFIVAGVALLSRHNQEK
jgi:phage shock protein C